MQADYFITQLTDHAETIRTLAHLVPEEQARWKPGPGQWSVLEVINHLIDEETEDFQEHLDLILHHPEQAWPHIDPQGWVTQRQYNQRTLVQSLAVFIKARQASLDWLKRLTTPNWEAVYASPFGPIKAGDMLVSWAGHDLLHIRQLVELHWAYSVLIASPYKLDYAGAWQE
jgi:hypothetical protein